MHAFSCAPLLYDALEKFEEYSRSSRETLTFISLSPVFQRPPQLDVASNSTELIVNWNAQEVA